MEIGRGTLDLFVKLAHNGACVEIVIHGSVFLLPGMVAPVGDGQLRLLHFEEGSDGKTEAPKEISKNKK